MKQLGWTILGALVLITMAFVTISIVLSKPRSLGQSETTMSRALPTALALFPDIDRVPVYPDATVTFSETQSTWRNYITYQMHERIDKVTEFYQEMLPKKGWQLRSSARDRYSWTDPTGKLRWQMQLRVAIEWTLDGSETVVHLDYGRYPNIEAGLPLYANAQQVGMTRSTIEKRFGSETAAVQVTEITYLSSASPQAIATFYTNALPEDGWSPREPGWSTQAYGWFPFDNPGSWAGDSRGEGLYFVGVRPKWDDTSDVVSYHLLATATQQKDGQVMIKLHIEEMSSSLGNF
jgi:hypothetical protein